MDADPVTYKGQQHRLRQAEERLIDHVRDDVRGDVHSGAVLPLDDAPLPAYDLYRVEAAVPDADAAQGERAEQRPLHRQEHVGLHHHAHQRADDRRHRQHLPVVLVDEHPEKLAQINPNLRESPAVAADSLDLK